MSLASRRGRERGRRDEAGLRGTKTTLVGPLYETCGQTRAWWRISRAVARNTVVQHYGLDMYSRAVVVVNGM